MAAVARLCYVRCDIGDGTLFSDPNEERNIGIAFGTLNALASMSLAVALVANLLIYG